ncbi:hypothetical protein AC623_18170 [Bacillus sp. FJAT-27231]|uniref:hypothetical protein n=1 Tax=Bacillus sp. FJAT-27231 TaxID=1679168 RepID=UPI0006715B51|nr:hypothetical protein [Bacillus sp. FJAT-27231]KMY55617.1 hypothetical protein AC623_18170 [Bacillus sp. FJAT-27231]
MQFLQKGTIADNTLHDTSLGNLNSLNIKSSESYDITAIFRRLSIQLDQLDKQESGTQEDLDLLSEELNRLPRFSEERLECDIRIKFLRGKWGLHKQVAKPEIKAVSFPIKTELIDNVLIEKMHTAYIDSGKAGRLWIQSWMRNQGITVIESKEKLDQLVKRAIGELENYIQGAKSASSEEKWKKALNNLGIQVDQKHVSVLFDNWIKGNTELLKNIGEIQRWISVQGKAILMNQESTSVLDDRLIEKVIKREE